MYVTRFVLRQIVTTDDNDSIFHCVYLWCLCNTKRSYVNFDSC